MPNLYIIAGPNGAGKTTASRTILPEILNCTEFVNADSIAAGLSPFNSRNIALGSGRIMLQRIQQLLKDKAEFAFETTLAAKHYVNLIKEAKITGYKVSLLYLWLSSPSLAKKRIAIRVSEGGHNIPPDIIERRFYRGLYNLINLYLRVCDEWMIYNNSKLIHQIIARGFETGETEIINKNTWRKILKQIKHEK